MKRCIEIVRHLLAAAAYLRSIKDLPLPSLHLHFPLPHFSLSFPSFSLLILPLLLHFSPLLPLLFHPLPLEVGSPQSSQGSWGSAVSSLTGRQTLFCAFWADKCFW